MQLVIQLVIEIGPTWSKHVPPRTTFQLHSRFTQSEPSLNPVRKHENLLLWIPFFKNPIFENMKLHGS